MNLTSICRYDRKAKIDYEKETVTLHLDQSTMMLVNVAKIMNYASVTSVDLNI